MYSVHSTCTWLKMSGNVSKEGSMSEYLPDGVSVETKTTNNFDFFISSYVISAESATEFHDFVGNHMENSCDKLLYPSHVLSCIDERTRKYVTYASCNMITDTTSSVATVSYTNKPIRMVKFTELEDYQSYSQDVLLQQCLRGNDNLTPTEKGGGISSNMTHPQLHHQSSGLLKHYHPGYSSWVSPHHKSPLEVQALLSERPITDTYLYMNVHSCGPKQYFEPLFMTASLYKVSTDGVFKISENFNVDCTPDNIRKEFDMHYGTAKNTATVAATNETGVSSTENSNIITSLKAGLFTITNDLKEQDVFIVFQIYKILSGDGDKAVNPYLRSTKNAEADQAKLREVCQKLHAYRQPVGIGAIKVFDKQWRVGQYGGPLVSTPVHAQRNGFSDQQIAQYVRDLYPVEENSQSKCKLDLLVDIDLRVSLYDLGREGQVAERLPADLIPADSYLFKHLVPSDFFDEQQELAMSKSLKSYGMATSPKSACGNNAAVSTTEPRSISNMKYDNKYNFRHILPMIPLGRLDEDDVSRKIGYKVDNSIYIYPLAFDRFNHRNLCLCVQLVEFLEPIPDEGLGMPSVCTMEHRVLMNVYNEMAHGNNTFAHVAKTVVSYHNKTPSLNDEIKIRLPNVMTDRHWLVFTIQHMHVRPKKDRSSFLGAMRRLSMDKESISQADDQLLADRSSVTVGYGYLQLLQEYPSSSCHSYETSGTSRSNSPVESAQSSQSGPEKFVDYRTDALVSDLNEHIVNIVPVNEFSVEGEEEETPAPLSNSSGGSKKRMSVDRNLGEKLVTPSVRIRLRCRSSLYSKCPRVQSYLKLQRPPLSVLPTSVPNLYSNVASCRGISSNAVKTEVERKNHYIYDDKVGEATMQLLQADSAEVGTFFFVIMRQLIRTMCSGGGGFSEINAVYSNPSLHPIPRCRAFVTMLHMFGKVAPNIVLNSSVGNASNASGDLNTGITDDVCYIPTEADMLTAYVEYLFDEEYVPLVNDGVASGNVEVAYNDMFSTYAEYEDSYSDHVVNESMRLLLESILDEFVGELGENEFSPTVATIREGKLYVHQNFQNLERLVRAGNRDVLDGHNGFGRFDPENQYFAHRDAGRALMQETDPEDLCISLNSDGDLGSCFCDVDYPPVSSVNNRVNSAVGSPNAQRGLSSASGLLESSSSIITHKNALHPYSYLKGYKDRVDTTSETKANSTAQWWPWLYEVIIYQWYSLLVCFQNKVSDDAITLSELGLQDLLNENVIQHQIPTASTTDPSDYYYAKNGIPFNRNREAQDTRTLLMDHSPYLFSMIIKSLILRIDREKKAVPVVFDEHLSCALEKLVCVIGVEIGLRPASQWHYERLNSSLSKFFCDLSAIVAPSLIATLLTSYAAYTSNSEQSRGPTAFAGAMEQKLRLLDRFSQLEYIIPLNFPLPIDSPVGTLLANISKGSMEHVGCDVDAMGKNMVVDAVNRVRCKLRGIYDPPPNWFSHLFISEVLSVYRKPDVNIKMKQYAVGILRDLLLRHSYDARFQKRTDVQVVATMYYPLLMEILKECEALYAINSEVPYDSILRKELLIIFLHLLQNIPMHVLREQFRISAGAAPPLGSSDHNASNVDSKDACTMRHLLLTRQYVLRRSNRNTLNKLGAFCRNNDVFRCIYLCHLALDTFEFPMSEGGEFGEPTEVLVPGLDAMLKGGNMTDANDHIDQKYQLEFMLRQKAGGGRRKVNKPLSSDSDTVKDGLETRKWKSKVVQRHSTGSSAMLARRNKSNTATISNFKDFNTTSAVKMTSNRMLLAIPNANPREFLNAAKGVSYECSEIVLHTLKMLLEEATVVFVRGIKDASSHDRVYHESIYLELLAQVCALVLHGLHTQQCEIITVSYINFCSLLFKKYSGKLIFKAMGDTLQDWLRALLGYSCSQNIQIRVPAANLLLLLFRSRFYFFGSFVPVAKVAYCVIGEVCHTVIVSHIPSSTNNKLTHAQADELIFPLHLSIYQLKKVCELPGTMKKSNLLTAFASSFVSFLNSLSNLICAHNCLRRHKQSVIIDYGSGCNMLDGPYDSKAMSLMSSARAFNSSFGHKSIYVSVNTNTPGSVHTTPDKGISINPDSSPAGVSMDGKERAVSVDGADLSSISLEGNRKFSVVDIESRDSAFTPNIPASTFNMSDSHAIMDCYMDAARIFNPLESPRQHLFWLENLTKYQEIQGNLSESAELRWKIYQVCCAVAAQPYANAMFCENTDPSATVWCPRQSLDWCKGGVAEPIVLDGSGNKSIVTRNFLLSLVSVCFYQQQSRNWKDRSQLMQHMETCLKVSADRYLAAHLFGLAERSWTHMVAMYRFEAQMNSSGVNSAQQKITGVYNKIVRSYKTMTEANVTFAMGSFFRVQYFGSGVPLSLRDKEYIYRNGKQLHVSEFQSLIKQHLIEVVANGTVVSVVPDSHQIPDESGAPTATIVMTSVKPLGGANIEGLVSIDQEIPFSFLRNDASSSVIPMYSGDIIEVANSATTRLPSLSSGCGIASSGQSNRFQYSVPFTIDTSGGSVAKRRAHAKTMDAQWKRTITLSVEFPFPYVMDRQLVCSRECRELSPIENAVDDILERIESMKALYEKSSNDASLKATIGSNGHSSNNQQPPTLSPELNNIMRLVQGTVMPQVNAGVAEVAKVFLGRGGTPASAAAKASLSVESTSSMLSDSSECRDVDGSELDNILLLQLTLIEFLLNAKKLLELTRKILIAQESNEDGAEDREPARSSSGSGLTPGVVSDGGTPGGSSMEYTYVVWQVEMEKAYDTLIDVITPYLLILDPNAVDIEFGGDIPLVKNKYNCNEVWRAVCLSRKGKHADST